MNDDGEPSGTAGRPIYGQLLSFDLTNTLVAVVRYFGGTKLGVSGLINAYKTAAQDALNNAEIITLKITDVYEIIYPYSMMNDVMKIIKEENLEQVSSSFELECKVSFLVEKNNSNKVYEKFQRFENLKINYLKTI
jgi:putative IMPACT (imprinted ancient) family translation regulator